MAIVSNPAAFCISLANSPRRAGFAAAAAAHSVAFEFIDATSITDLRNGTTLAGCRIDLTDLSWTRYERFDPRRQHAPIMFGEIGCAYSHIRCWQIGRAMDLDYICVFEDDSVICRNLEGIDIPDGIDILYLSDRVPHNERGEITGEAGGTEGYLMSRVGMLKSLEIFKVLCMPIDLQMIAHQPLPGATSPSLFDYRRDIDSGYNLTARVVGTPYCLRQDDDSQIYEFDPRAGVAGQERRRLEEDLRRAEADSCGLEEDLRRALAERDGLRLELEAMHRSTSWRLTAPVRAIGTALRRGRG